MKFFKSFKASPYLLMIAAIVFAFGSVKAQVSAYNFAQAAGGITALTATYTEHTTGTTDFGTYTAVPIGFTFKYKVGSKNSFFSLSLVTN